jgi:subtilisin family serine protease
MSATTPVDVLDYAVDTALDVQVQAASSSTSASSSLAAARNRYGLDGAGQTVAVIDTGVAYDHKALGGGLGAGYRVVGGYDFAEGDSNPYDDGSAGGHGTHVSGIIAASDAVYSGVAPGVDLVSLRVFNDAGSTSMALIEQALRWVHNNRLSFRNPITTVNLSLGTQANTLTPAGGAILEDELAQLQADGIFISVAAGNNFTTYLVPGLSYPASSPYVVPVSSVDANGAMSSYSQRSSRAIAAPGRSITSTVPDYLGNKNGVADDYAKFSGTSMAAPYVAGAAVLLREAFYSAGVVGVSQQTIYNQMVNTADTVYDPSTCQSYLRLNLTRALDAVMLYGRGSPDPSTLGLYNPSSGIFYLRNSNTSGMANTTLSYGPRKSSWTALVGDWDGDGVDTVGLYNQSTGTFYLRNSNRSGSYEVTFSFGAAGAGWMPVVGDWNGDGVDTIGLYNPATSTFSLRNRNSGGTADVTLAYGHAGAGWQPIAGDWNGDGVETVGLYNPTSSMFYLKNSLQGGFADLTFAYGAGGAGWLPMAGDFNGDGIDTIGLYSSGTSLFYLRNSNSTGYADSAIAFGAAGAGWVPVVGSWDGRVSSYAASTSTLGSETGSLPSLGSSELTTFGGSELADAVAHAVTTMEQQQAWSEQTLPASLHTEQSAIGTLATGSNMVVDPQAVDHVDLASVLQETHALDETDLTAISRITPTHVENDAVFGEDGLLDVLG